jgi:nicotinic acid mononucleotide adenylyltransferase
VKAVGQGQAEVKKTVLIFGLSANPPTGMGGHAGIVAWGGKDLRVDLPNDESPEKSRERVGIDEVWVLPVYKHAFASKSNLLPFEHREAMARLAFEKLPGLEGRVQVKDTEKQVIEGAFAKAAKDGQAPETVRVGTIDVIRKLMTDHPDTQFVLALGGDTFSDLRGGKWKEGDTLQQLVPIVVLPRAGVDGVAGTEQNAPKLTDISSTKVRASTDEAFLSEALHPDVLAYMKSHKLYGFGEGQ